MEKTSWDLSPELQQCQYCRTEYHAGFEHNNACTINFKVTIWKDLGRGLEGEEWKAHMAPRDRNSRQQPIQFRRGEIAPIFQEGGTGESWR